MYPNVSKCITSRNHFRYKAEVAVEITPSSSWDQPMELVKPQPLTWGGAHPAAAQDDFAWSVYILDLGRGAVHPATTQLRRVLLVRFRVVMVMMGFSMVNYG